MAEPRQDVNTRAVRALGDRWVLSIVRELLHADDLRYSDLRDRLALSDSVLSTRLDTMVQDELIERAESGYRIAPQGADLWALLVSIWTWERDWADETLLPRQRLWHLDCGASTRPDLCCASCDRVTSVRQVRPVLADGRGAPATPAPAGQALRRLSDRGRVRMPGALAVVGDRWSGMVIAAVMRGLRRFTDLQHATGASPAVLSDRLRRLVDSDLLVRRPDDGGASRFTYRLTPRGRDFWPISAQLIAWGERWYGDPRQPAVQFAHVVCGDSWAPRLLCDQCGDPVEWAALTWADARPLNPTTAPPGRERPPS